MLLYFLFSALLLIISNNVFSQEFIIIIYIYLSRVLARKEFSSNDFFGVVESVRAEKIKLKFKKQKVANRKVRQVSKRLSIAIIKIKFIFYYYSISLGFYSDIRRYKLLILLSLLLIRSNVLSDLI